jgi:hypothetical protein
LASQAINRVFLAKRKRALRALGIKRIKEEKDENNR